MSLRSALAPVMLDTAAVLVQTASSCHGLYSATLLPVAARARGAGHSCSASAGILIVSFCTLTFYTSLQDAYQTHPCHGLLLDYFLTSPQHASQVLHYGVQSALCSITSLDLLKILASRLQHGIPFPSLFLQGCRSSFPPASFAAEGTHQHPAGSGHLEGKGERGGYRAILPPAHS